MTEHLTLQEAVALRDDSRQRYGAHSDFSNQNWYENNGPNSGQLQHTVDFRAYPPAILKELIGEHWDQKLRGESGALLLVEQLHGGLAGEPDNGLMHIDASKLDHAIAEKNVGLQAETARQAELKLASQKDAALFQQEARTVLALDSDGTKERVGIAFRGIHNGSTPDVKALYQRHLETAGEIRPKSVAEILEQTEPKLLFIEDQRNELAGDPNGKVTGTYVLTLDRGKLRELSGMDREQGWSEGARQTGRMVPKGLAIAI